MSTHQKLSIQHHLASILNLSPTDDDDYISEILDQLLCIENPDDVKEYLGNFMTDDSSGDVDLFVDNLCQFKSSDEAPASKIYNEPVEIKDEKSERVTPASTRILDEGAAQREAVRLRELEARERQREEQRKLQIKKIEEERLQQRKKGENAANEQSASKWEQKVSKNKSNTSQHTTTPKAAANQSAKCIPKKTAAQAISQKSSNPILSKPLKGNPKTICGCFGNHHPPLTNCLQCGRISCELEGYDYCPFCNNLITKVATSGITNNDSAMAHKERLLEYDRTSASRTYVHDDQEDYFVTQTSMWSSEQEQEDACILEEERRKKLHQRGNQVLDIKF